MSKTEKMPQEMIWARKRLKAASDGARHLIEELRPYPSLLLLVAPISVVEPLKVVALFVAGDGHWITGTFIIVLAYCASLLLVHRLFGIVKPKLVMIPWFKQCWEWFVAIRQWLGFH